MNESMTLTEALTRFGDFVLTNDKPPTASEYREVMELSSESVANRWLRVLEREGLLAERHALFGHSITREGYEYLYRQQRTAYLKEQQS